MRIIGFIRSSDQYPRLLMPLFSDNQNRTYIGVVDRKTIIRSFVQMQAPDPSRFLTYRSNISLELGSRTIFYLETSVDQGIIVDIVSLGGAIVDSIDRQDAGNAFSAIELGDFADSFAATRSASYKITEYMKSLSPAQKKWLLGSRNLTTYERPFERYIRWAAQEEADNVDLRCVTVRGPRCIVEAIYDFSRELIIDDIDIIKEACVDFANNFCLQNSTKIDANQQADTILAEACRRLQGTQYPNDFTRIDRDFYFEMNSDTANNFYLKSGIMCDSIAKDEDGYVIYGSLKSVESANMYIILRYLIFIVPEFEDFVDLRRKIAGHR